MSTDFVAATFPVLSATGSEAVREAEERAAVRGHAAGYAAGRRQAEDELAVRARELDELLARAVAERAAEVEAVVRGLDDVRRALEIERDRTAAHIADGVLDLAVELAEIIVHRSLEDERATAVAALERVLSAAGDSAVLEVRMHPEDLVLLPNQPVGGVALKPDPMLRRGDARASLESGGVDAVLASALRRVREALSGGAV